MKKRVDKKTGPMEPIPPELVLRARDGDQAAFTELYERTSAMIYRTIRSMVRDEDLVWDIQQDSRRSSVCATTRTCRSRTSPRSSGSAPVP